MNASTWNSATVYEMMQLRLSNCCNQFCYWLSEPPIYDLCEGLRRCCGGCPILPRIKRPFSERKTRLFVMACARRTEALMIKTADPGVSRILDYAENLAEFGFWTDTRVPIPEGTLSDGARTIGRICINSSVLNAYNQAVNAIADSRSDGSQTRYSAASQFEYRIHADMFRDIIGNPFAPIVFDDAWITPRIVAIAEDAYDNRLPYGRLDPEILAVLSDALEDVGASQAILDDLRTNRTRYRGAWSLDLILERIERIPHGARRSSR